MSLESYYQEFMTGAAAGDYYGYTCPYCKMWVYSGSFHYCGGNSWYPAYTYPPENKTEKAFQVLKILVEKKIITEPSTFRAFCDLIEKIAGAI
jgi:hypothetical protein